MSDTSDERDEIDGPPGTRLHVEQPLVAGNRIALDARAVHYLRNVIRLGTGDEILLFNGRDGEYRARLESVVKRGADALPLVRVRAPAAEPDVWLLVAPVKRMRLDLIVEKATELGVARVMPVITRHTVVSRVNCERLALIAIEAAEQCERLTVPVVDAPVALDRALAAWPSGRRLLVADERRDAPPAADVLRGLQPGPWAVLVGPEGGFAEQELDAIRQFQFVTPIGLGPRVLRADTAVTAALAVAQSWIGDWGVRRGADR